MLAQALETQAFGRLLGYGGSWRVAKRVAKALQVLSGPKELHVGQEAVPELGLGVEVRRPKSGHLGSLMESLREEAQAVWCM